jgi:type II secretory pathway component PulF
MDPKAQETSPTRSIVISLVLHAIAGAALAAFLIFVAPRMDKLFADFQTELPVLTNWVLEAGRVCSKFWHGLLVLAIAALVVDYYVLRAAHRHGPTAATIWSFGITILFNLLLLAGVIALFLPLRRVLWSLS